MGFVGVMLLELSQNHAKLPSRISSAGTSDSTNLYG
jgi:hypothetical protein